MIVRGSRAGRRRVRPRPRPSPTARRASARSRFSPRRAIAALVMVAAAAAIYGLAVSPAFAVRTIETQGAVLTGDAAVIAALGVGTASSGTGASGPAVGGVPTPSAARDNVFTLKTAPLAARVVTLPTIASATVTAALPDAIRVDVVEREPILVWSVGARRLLVDRDGLVLLDAAAQGAPDATRDLGHSLPAIVDARARSAGLAAGGRVDPVDLDAATRLASLQPRDVGSRAKTLAIAVTDADGWVVSTAGGWDAVFGFYTATVRPPDLVPAQVRLLRSLLAGREAQLGRVMLASGDAGTYTLR